MHNHSKESQVSIGTPPCTEEVISLFNIPNHVIDTSEFSNHLHGSIVTEFEKEFCNYVGAKYACSLDSATNAIFLAMERERLKKVTIPSMLPHVVCNALHHAGVSVEYRDDTEWVGGSYELHDFGEYKIIDSAQRVDRDQFHEVNDQSLMIFSFYPTKPVGGMDGGIIVSNDKDKIDYFKQRSLNGMAFSENNWERKQVSIGWKMYMNSSQAYVALQNLRKLDEKKERLEYIRLKYNKALGQLNTSHHLYRINVKDRATVRYNLKEKGIITGIHYDPLHKSDVYGNNQNLIRTEQEAASTISIPFHEALTDQDVERVIYELRV